VGVSGATRYGAGSGGGGGEEALDVGVGRLLALSPAGPPTSPSSLLRAGAKKQGHQAEQASLEGV